ncbi:LemA family protein [Empedobacter sedimenti]|uniref:LemA family protein n=1 Tax=Empedobacter sedimenti TaxID=3042610 RepID=UPI0024A72B47|nr:LemA family protein [Empedobacter sedimenti]
MIWTYNKIVKNRNQITFAKQNIDIQLKKRFEALPNIAATVKRFLEHENSLHTDISKLRTQYENSTSSKEKYEVEHQISDLFSKILISVENYPIIKTEESVLHLQRSINELTEHISAAERAYNGAVLEYNNSISIFPNNVLASIFNFKTEEYMQLITAPEQRKNPDISTII